MTDGSRGVCVADPEVKKRAEKFLFCPPDDTDTLSHVITQNDLLGVSQLIVKVRSRRSLCLLHSCAGCLIESCAVCGGS